MNEYNLSILCLILSFAAIYIFSEAINYIRIVIREELERVGLTKEENKE